MDQFPRAGYHHCNLQLRTIRSRKALILTTERLMSTLLLPSNSSLAPCTSTTHITAKSLGDHGRAGQFKFGLHDAVLLSNGRLICKHYRTKGILNVIICACVDNIATTLSRRRTDRSLTFQVSNFSGPALLPRKTRTTPASTHFNFYCDQQGWKH